MKGCLVLGLAGAVLFALIGLGAFKMLQSFKSATENFPQYAKRDAVYARYGSLIEAIEANIEASESMHDLAARLEKLNAPDELLYLTLTREGDSFDKEKLEIVERMEVTSNSYTLINDTGHGKINGKRVIVIRLPVNRWSLEECFVYLRYQASPATPDKEKLELSGSEQLTRT